MTDLTNTARDILAASIDRTVQLADRYLYPLAQHEWAMRQIDALQGSMNDRHWIGCTDALRLLRTILAQIAVVSARAEALDTLSVAMAAVDECEMLDAIAGSGAGTQWKRVMGGVL